MILSKFSLISLLLRIIHSKTASVLVPPRSDVDEPVSILESNSNYLVYQSQENITFSLDFLLNNDSTTNFYMIEVYVSDAFSEQIDNQFRALLMTMQGYPPYQVQEDQGQARIYADIIDSEGYLLGKTYLNNVLTTNDPAYDPSLPQYVTLLIPIDMQISYYISVEEYMLKPCPMNCGNSVRGKCWTNGECQCQIPFLGDDCQINGVQLQISKPQFDSIQTQVRYYFLQPPLDFKDDLVLEIELQTPGAIDVAVKLEGNGLSSLPSQLDNDAYQTITDSTYKIKLSNQYFNILDKYIRRRRFYIAVYPSRFSQKPDGEVASFQIRVEKDSDDDDGGIDSSWILIYFLIGIASLLFVSWIIITIVRIKYTNRAAAAAANPNNPNGPPRPRPRGVQLTLTKEDIDQYMPVLSHDDIKEELEKCGGACSVCLQEFTSQDTFRRTPCKHIFHPQCIEEWLKKAENCPNCRELLTKPDMDKLIQQQQQQAVEPQPRSEQDSKTSQVIKVRPSHPISDDEEEKFNQDEQFQLQQPEIVAPQEDSLVNFEEAVPKLAIGNMGPIIAPQENSLVDFQAAVEPDQNQKDEQVKNPREGID